MINKNLFLVVIAGGSGTRFWPKSTSKRPKQLLNFHPSSVSLLEQTLSRFDQLVSPEKKMIVTTQFLKQAILEMELRVEILAEPQGRNTAPCIYWAARQVAEKNPKGIMLVMPSDHYIARPDSFISVIEKAAQWAAENDDLVTLGIEPSRPETGYGYLKTSPISENKSSLLPKRVESFIEKPSLEKAQKFIQSGDYLWNGGMFLWRAEVILKAFDAFMPEMKKAWNKSLGKIEEVYPLMTATSIDYGIMEKAKNVVTFPLDCGWDDLGSWTSLENLAVSLHAQQGSNVVTAGEVLAMESERNIIDTPKRFVALLGVNDLIIVEQGEALLIAHKDRSQEIRKIVEETKKRRPDLI